MVIALYVYTYVIEFIDCVLRDNISKYLTVDDRQEREDRMDLACRISASELTKFFKL